MSGASETPDPEAEPAGPMAGMRVLDLTSVAFGPLATQNFGDMGADVIKIEGPGGDTTRLTGPARSSGMAAFFLSVNRNKRSVVLDLKQQSARDALWRLIDGADVFIHSIRPQAVERLGFGPQAALDRNPRLVYAGLHGYGQRGPYSGQPAYDDVIQGRSGAVDLMTRLVGEPRYFPSIIADKTCAMIATWSVLAALLARERSGRGQFVEVPMFESMVAFNLTEHMNGHVFEPPEQDLGYPRVLAPWRRPYRTLDGHCCMLAYTDVQWRRFWTEVGEPQLADDPRFDSLASRARNINEIYETAGKLMALRPTAEWLRTLQALEIPCAEVTALEALEDDPHLQAVQMFQVSEHPSEGPIRMTRPAVDFSGSPASIRRPAPRLGEHSFEVLLEAGLDGADVEAMLASGATGVTAPLK